MVYITEVTASGMAGSLIVWIQSEMYQNRIRYHLCMSGGFNGGPGFSKSIKTGLPKKALPNGPVTISRTLHWYDYSPDVTAKVKLTKNGTLRVSVGSGPSGMALVDSSGNAGVYFHDQ